MFGFNKKKHRSNIRIRREDHDEDSRPLQAPAPSSTKSKPKKSKSKKVDRLEDKDKTMPKLSFDDEIKADVDFKVKKSSISRKLAREREREKSKKIKDVMTDQDFTNDEDFIVMDDMDLDGEDMAYNTDNHPYHKPSLIPDANAIHQARKKREQARRQQESDNSYIPLKNRRINSDKVYKPAQSRLIREEDDSGDERVDMKVHTEEDNVESIHLLEGDINEEDLEWENAQIRKGASIKTGTDISTNNNVRFIYEKQPAQLSVNDYIPKFVMPEISIDAISNELVGELNSLKSLVEEGSKDLDSTNKALENTEKNITKYETQIADIASSFEFYQETKCFINDYSKLLSLKIDAIESVENDIYTLFRKRSQHASTLRKSQQERLAIQVGIIKPAPEPRPNPHVETIPRSSPDSDEEVEEDFVKKYNSIVDASETVMSDVREEFTEINFVKKYFEKWKAQESESYRNAYITHCLPRVFSPLIRLEMLGWNPLQPSCPNFEDYGWFVSLMSYGTQEGRDPVPDDPDTNLIPIIIHKVLFPKVTRLIKLCWDPFSTKQTQRLAELLKLFFEDYPCPEKKSPEKDKLIEALQYHIEQLIIHEAYLPFAAERSPNTDSKVERFLTFQFIKCVKILKNILCWEGVLPSDTIFRLSIDSLLNRHLVAFLQTSVNHLDNVDKIDMIVKILPVLWFERSDKLLEPLTSFANYLATLAQILERKQAQCATELERKIHKTAHRKVMSMLLRLNAMELVRRK